MLEGYSPVVQALLGTLFTWGVTALGSALVFVLDSKDQKFNQQMLDSMLGFAAGVMIAASYWSLLAPAIESAEQAGYGQWAFLPAAVGFAAGGVAMFAADDLLTRLGIVSPEKELAAHKKDDDAEADDSKAKGTSTDKSWRRTLLLVIAVTVHNFPEGMAVGVGFGGQGKGPGATFANARSLAIGIGLQNFPEGLAVSMPLRREGMHPLKAFWYGQLSGMVEPVGGLLGAYAIIWIEPLLPYALSFAAGCMIFVVVDNLIPEAAESGNHRLATIGTMIGFIVMMTMDVALG